MERSRITTFARLTMACLLAAGAAFAQSRDTAAVFGTVSDTQGAAVPGVKVRLINTATGEAREVAANEEGAYVFNLIRVGNYMLSAEAPSFRRFEQRGIVLQANENVKVDVKLEVGDVKTTVEVEALGSLVETRAVTLKETVDRTRVVELPINGRNPADLALLVPGVTSGTTNNSGNTADGNNIRPRGQKMLSVNGSRNNNLRYTLDGGENMDNLFNFNLPFPFPDALQEFSVQTANMTVDHGNSSGGTVNVVTKSGTNQVHGDAFWFLRNTELNASNFFSRQQDKLKRNQVGFDAGGPVIKNKLFLFGGFQQLWIRSASGADRTQTLSAAERRGDFSGIPDVINDPSAGRTPFPGNRIPTNRLSAAALKLLEVSPLPDPDGFTRYVIARPEQGRQYVGRADYTPGTRHNFYFRAFQNQQNNPYESPATNIHAVRTQGYQDSINATVSHNFILSPSMIMHTQLTGMHLKSEAESTLKKSFRDFGVDLYAPSNDISVSMTNSGAGLSADPRVGFKRATEEFIHDWNWTKGNHSLTWGVQLNWRQYNEDTIFRSSGYFEFDGHVTASRNSDGFDRADFMLGGFSYFTQNNGEKENRRQFTKGFYAADTWRLTPKFTLTLGLRYEPYQFFWDLLDRNQTFDQRNYAGRVKSQRYTEAPPGLLFPGDKDPDGGIIGRSLMKPDNNNWAPRVGIAWDPFGNGKTSIRAGFGAYYDTPSLQAQNDANNVSPFSYSVQFYDGLLDKPYRGRESSNRFPVLQFSKDTPFDSPLYTIVLDGKYVTTSAMNWNLTAEREVVRDTRLRLAYVGTKGTHLKSEYDQNAAIYNPRLSFAANRATIQERRPRPEYDEISRWFFGLNSSYHAFQMTLDKRFHKGYTVLVSYTWSKTLDYISQNGFGGGNQVANPFNLFFRHSVADQHRPQRLVTSFVWDLPAAGASAAAKAVTGNWKLSGILAFQAGRPFGIGASPQPVPGGGRGFVDLLGSGSPVLDTSRSKGEKIAAYFDNSRCGTARCRFANPDPGQYGTLGRNAMLGPGFSNIDISLVKGFALPFLGERGLGQFRFESFNLFNRTNFGNPNTGITNVNFGRLTGTDGDPRILQLALKFAF
ncbi:MAG: TonB-dependent receptor [Acidobacteria bacterium]|nr:TonB-dependent receptor [Acidobacteriota bacterium]